MSKKQPKSNKDYFITPDMRENPFALFVDGERREKETSLKHGEEAQNEQKQTQPPGQRTNGQTKP